MAQTPSFTPLACSPLIPFLIPSHLLGIPLFVWCNTVHLGPRLLENWPPVPHLSPIPPHFKFPAPFGFSPPSHAPYSRSQLPRSGTFTILVRTFSILRAYASVTNVRTNTKLLRMCSCGPSNRDFCTSAALSQIRIQIWWGLKSLAYMGFRTQRIWIRIWCESCGSVEVQFLKVLNQSSATFFSLQLQKCGYAVAKQHFFNKSLIAKKLWLQICCCLVKKLGTWSCGLLENFLWQLFADFLKFSIVYPQQDLSIYTFSAGALNYTMYSAGEQSCWNIKLQISYRILH